MIRTYEPVCEPCRKALATYYITCQGCQVRRAKALAKVNAPLPSPSIPKPPQESP